MKTKSCNTTPIRFVEFIPTQSGGQAFILYLKAAGIAILMVLGLLIQSNAQVISSEDENAKYVKIEIAENGLHCPFLGVKLEYELKKINGLSDLYINNDESYLTFNLPIETDITKEKLEKIPVDVGYPSKYITVIMADKPIKNDE